MKITFLAAGAFAVALALPLGAYAQQNQPPGVTAQRTTTPSQAKIQHGWMKRLGNLNLSGGQQQRIQSMINQYSQAHPQGSPRDREAGRNLRRQILSVLNSDQQNQYHQQMRARREQMQQRRGQMQQGSQSGPQNQGPQYQGGPQDQGPQYQGGPPDQGPQGQGPPPDQGPQGQGPPPDQGPQGQGPPPDQGPQGQGPPPDQGPQGQGPPPA